MMLTTFTPVSNVWKGFLIGVCSDITTGVHLHHLADTLTQSDLHLLQLRVLLWGPAVVAWGMWDLNSQPPDY